MSKFVKGDPRINRKGRAKKGQTMTDILTLKLDSMNEAGTMRREAVAEKLIAMALGGDLGALKYIFDRCDGRPRESLELVDNGIDNKLRELLNGGE